MTPYLTYARYQELGGTLSSADFAMAEFKARKRIDRMTNCRVQKMGTVPEAVTLCTYALIGLESTIGIAAQTSNPLVTSYNTDGYSESYGHLPSIAESEAHMNKVVTACLYGETDDNGIPLLYRGVYD